MVRIKFFPPIAHRINEIERNIAFSTEMNIVDFIIMLQSQPSFEAYFERITRYGGTGDFLPNLIVLVNDSVADDTCRIKDGDVVKLILPLAGG